MYVYFYACLVLLRVCHVFTCVFTMADCVSVSIVCCVHPVGPSFSALMSSQRPGGGGDNVQAQMHTITNT